MNMEQIIFLYLRESFIPQYEDGVIMQYARELLANLKMGVDYGE